MKYIYFVFDLFAKTFETCQFAYLYNMLKYILIWN